MEEKTNRNNVNRIKKIIIGFFLMLLLVPTILSLYLMFRVSSLEAKMDLLIEQGNQPVVIQTTSAGDASEDSASKDVKARDSIEKDTTAPNALLSNTKPTPTDATETDAEEEEEVVPWNGKRVYLTFDDGPSAYTDEILDILEEKDVKATFFVVVNDYTYTEELNKIVNAGHTLGMHSMTHDYGVIYANMKNFKADVQGTHDLIYDMTGVDTKYYRFPGGSSNQVSGVSMSSCVKWLDKKGYVFYDWNALNGDAETLTYSAAELNQHVMNYVDSNEGDSVVLLHDLETHAATVEALPELIDTLKAEGYELCAIDDNAPVVQHFIREEDR